ncbi:MAG: tRNA (adenosine(37)-N6)-dimethylallyltransferase MiaA [Bdellovibrionales bacterium]|nr:tRNA (adenosine(37)-N6)-dimethylallyltransferase MiaA [Bdellovibrionales bacterium]
MMKVVFILGPTASGKTNVAINLAKEFGGEIISCDSIQIYKGLDIGSSKPSIEEQQGVKHHLLSAVEIGEKYTAGDFRRDALKILQSSQEKVMWVVGGTGFYFKALEFGMANNPKMNDHDRAQLLTEWQSKLLDSFYEELQKKDSARAAEIDRNDSYRIFRAIEILRLGYKPSELKTQFKPDAFPFPLLKIGLQVDKMNLRQNVRARVQGMLDNGFIKEVERLRTSGFKDWEPMHSVGYKEIGQYLDKEIIEADLVEQITTKTMQLAKRQITWLKKDTTIHWHDLANITEIKNQVKSFLGVENE